MKRVGENVDNSVYGKTKVEVPFLEAVHARSMVTWPYATRIARAAISIRNPTAASTKHGRRRARFSKAAGKLSCGAIPKERTGGAALCGLAKSIQV